MKKIMNLAIVGTMLWFVSTKAPGYMAKMKKGAEDIAATQISCASHTAAANEVIDWASK